MKSILTLETLKVIKIKILLVISMLINHDGHENGGHDHLR